MSDFGFVTYSATKTGTLSMGQVKMSPIRAADPNAEMAFVDKMKTVAFPTARRAWWTLMIDMAGILIGLPVALGIVAGATTNSLQDGMVTGGMSLTLAMMSVFATLIGQPTLYFRPTRWAWMRTVAVIVLGAAGWAAVGIFELCAFFIRPGDVRWLLWAVIFFALAGVTVWSVTTRRTKGRWSLQRAVLTLWREKLLYSTDARSKRIGELERRISSLHPLRHKPKTRVFQRATCDSGAV